MLGRERPRPPPVNAKAPVLKRDGYFTVPDIKRLRRMSDDKLQVLPELSDLQSVPVLDITARAGTRCHAD